jgi:hypothetical protein
MWGQEGGTQMMPAIRLCGWRYQPEDRIYTPAMLLRITEFETYCSDKILY